MLALLAEAQRAAAASVARADPGRERQRQGGRGRAARTPTGRARGRPFVALNAGGVPARADRERAVRPRARRVHRRGRARAAACSSRPRAARCSWTRSASCRWRSRRAAARARDAARCGASAASRHAAWTCAWSARPTATCARWSHEGRFRQDLYLPHRARGARGAAAARAAARTSPRWSRQLLLASSQPMRRQARAVGRGAWPRCSRTRWPGNVRELRNVLSAAAAGECGARSSASELERAIDRVGGSGRYAVRELAIAARGGRAARRQRRRRRAYTRRAAHARCATG